MVPGPKLPSDPPCLLEEHVEKSAATDAKDVPPCSFSRTTSTCSGDLTKMCRAVALTPSGGLANCSSQVTRNHQDRDIKKLNLSFTQDSKDQASPPRSGKPFEGCRIDPFVAVPRQNFWPTASQRHLLPPKIQGQFRLQLSWGSRTCKRRWRLARVSFSQWHHQIRRACHNNFLHSVGSWYHQTTPAMYTYVVRQPH